MPPAYVLVTDPSGDAFALSGAAPGALESGRPGRHWRGGWANNGLLEGAGLTRLLAADYFDDGSEIWVTLPRFGDRQQRADGDRVLFSFDVEDRTPAAFIVVNDADTAPS